jgi:flagellar motility protein MotE (MotC chaperone)
MSKLTNPIVAAVLAIIMGTGTGLYTFWRAAGAVLEQAVKNVPHSKEAVPAAERERGWNFWTIEIENLANELKGERDRQHKLGEQLDHRETQMAAERQELNKIRTEIEGLRQEIATKVVEINADELKNIRGLAQTYSTLTPHAAVAIIREMDDTMAVKILSVMKPDVVAPIFEEMSKTAGADGPMARRAALLSDRLRLMKTAKASSSP